MYEYGGVYCDTDIEVKKALPESLFDNKCVFGFMYDNLVSSAFIMAEPHCGVIKGLLDLYEDGNVTMNTPNNDLYTAYLKDCYPDTFRLTGKKQMLEQGVWIYPKEYFECPTFAKEGGFTVHHFAASWIKKDFKPLRTFFNVIRFYFPLIDWYLQTRGRKRGYRFNQFYKQAELDKQKEMENNSK